MEAQSRDYRRLQVWQKAHLLVLAIYRVTSTFPREEVYSLTSQMQRAAVSIPANIAEGCGRGGSKEMARYMTISQGSANELEYYIQLSHDLGYLERECAADLYRDVREVAKMLAAYIVQLKTPRPTPKVQSAKASS